MYKPPYAVTLHIVTIINPHSSGSIWKKMRIQLKCNPVFEGIKELKRIKSKRHTSHLASAHHKEFISSAVSIFNYIPLWSILQKSLHTLHLWKETKKHAWSTISAAHLHFLQPNEKMINLARERHTYVRDSQLYELPIFVSLPLFTPLPPPFSTRQFDT